MGVDNVERTPQIEILPATPDDAKGIQDLMRASVLATYAKEGVTEEDLIDFYKEEHSPEGLKKLMEELANPKSGATHFVAKDNGTVVGYCKAWNGTPDNPKQNLLARIHVLPHRKAERIGSGLWDRVQKELDPNKPTALWVVEKNAAAIAVYEEHWGFKRTGKSEERTYKSGTVQRAVEMIHPPTSQEHPD